MVDGKMGFLFFLAVVALGAIAWLLFSSPLTKSALDTRGLV